MATSPLLKRGKRSSKALATTGGSGGGALWLFAAPLVAVLLHLPSLNYHFAGDDHEYLTFNADADPYNKDTSWLGLFRHDTLGFNITELHSDQEYRPLCVLSWRLDRYLLGAGDNAPWVYHLHNIILHGVVVLLFQQVAAIIMDPEMSHLAALVFATHPTHVHSVANIAGRGELMGAAFQFGAVLLWWHGSDPLGASTAWGLNRTLLLGAFLLFVGLGCLSHHGCALTVPLVLLMQLVHSVAASGRVVAAAGGGGGGAAEEPQPQQQQQQHKEPHEPQGGSPEKKGGGKGSDKAPGTHQNHNSNGGSGETKAPRKHKHSRPSASSAAWIWHAVSWGALAVAVGAFRSAVGPPTRNSLLPHFVDNPTAHLSGLPRTLSLLYTHLLHIGVLLFPFQLCVDYSYSALPPISRLLSLQGLVAVSGLPVLGWGLWNMWKQRDLLALFAYAWLSLQLLPFSGILYDARALLSPRTLLVPSAAFCVLVTLMAHRLKVGGRLLGRPIIVAMTAVFAFTAFVQMPAYKHHVDFWTTAMAQNPLNAKANFKMAAILGRDVEDLRLNEGKLGMVLELFGEALRIYPDYDLAMVERGVLFQALGDIEKSDADLVKAANLGNPEAHFQLGLLYMTDVGDKGCELAEWNFAEAIRIMPSDHRSYTNTGICRYWLDDLENATTMFNEALKLTPLKDIGVPADAMANIHRRNGDLEKALELHWLAVENSPDSAAFRSNLAFTLYDSGRYLEAAAQYDEVAERHPLQRESFKANADLCRQMLMSTISLGNWPMIEVPEPPLPKKSGFGDAQEEQQPQK